MADKEKVIPLEDRIPKLKQQRRQKANRRLILYISIFFSLILIVLYFQSSLSNVGSVKVTGNQFLSKAEIISASGITTERSFWDVDIDETEAKVKQLKQVKSVTVLKNFPNRVVIKVEENKRVAYRKGKENYYPFLETGEKLPPLEEGKVPVGAPILVHWKEGEQLKRIAAELSNLPEAIHQRISEVHFTPTDKNSSAVVVYMSDGFEVWANINDFSQKMRSYPVIVSNLDSKAEGIIHMRVSIYFEKYHGKEETPNEKQD